MSVRHVRSIAIVAVLLVFSCTKDEGGSSASGYCVPEGQKCTGVDAYVKCSNSCEKAADCGDACSEYKSCVSKCDCDSALSCASGCESKITDACQTCMEKVEECTSSKCTAPMCTDAEDDGGSGGTSGGGGSSGTGGSSGGTHTCSDLSSCCSGLPAGSSKTNCEDAVSDGDQEICDTYYLVYCD